MAELETELGASAGQGFYRAEQKAFGVNVPAVRAGQRFH